VVKKRQAEPDLGLKCRGHEEHERATWPAKTGWTEYCTRCGVRLDKEGEEAT